MNLEQAIQTAIAYEKKIRDLYVEASEQVKELGIDNIFTALAKDESYHASYLERQLDLLRKSDRITPETLKSNIPSWKEIEESVDSLRQILGTDHRGLVQQLLNSALKAELETSSFYRKTISQLDSSGQELFSRFIEMENNHIDAVQYQLDYISKTGYWFGVKEFDME